MSLSKWDRRIQRADELAEEHPYAADGLRFYRCVAGFQKGLDWYLKESGVTDLGVLAPKFPEFLSQVAAIAPEPIAQSAREWTAQPSDQIYGMLTLHWRTPAAVTDPEGLLARLFMQPYAEHLAEGAESNPDHANPATCPFCSDRPAVSVLRPEGDGAKRSLICAMCSMEWSCGRIVCPACGEEAADKLAVYTADQFPHVRIDACDSCGHYIKTIDLSRNGRAIPVVDDLASIPLDLWALEHSYSKLQINLLGI
ncbi:MAG TPA: formate dehydrogenase accessory protein FdhE [Bryobacteraceae bacterium]|nr:formate dehydrogenase accessory protein FdhE [Bryobacteraceae bacterium]